MTTTSAALIAHNELSACCICPRAFKDFVPACKCGSSEEYSAFEQFVNNWFSYQQALRSASAQEFAERFPELVSAENADELSEQYADGIRQLCRVTQCGLYMIMDFDSLIAQPETELSGRNRAMHVGIIALRNLLVKHYPHRI
jgi:hypothetical protein